MLEQKIRLKKAIENEAPIKTVIGLWNEYCEAYERLHKPSEHHIKDYLCLMDKYTKYIHKQKNQK